MGILGGSFNPPHDGHLALARAARDALELDELLLMPVATAPHKELPGDPGPAERVALCRLAVAGERGLGVSTIEVDRGGASYTADTLRGLHDERPGDELTFIVGADMAASLPTWREPETVLRLARLAVAGRGGTRREQIATALAGLEGGGAAVFFDMPPVEVSSSQVRARIAAGESLDGYVPDAVAARIAERGLYRPADHQEHTA